MKNPELFHKTVDILVKAYFRGDLNAFSCFSCAVGNILGHGEWRGCARDERRKELIIMPVTMHSSPNKSGYSNEELSDIEKAFLIGIGSENHHLDSTKGMDKENFKGLMSVIDTLQRIHECTDEEREEAKLKFQQA